MAPRRAGSTALRHPTGEHFFGSRYLGISSEAMRKLSDPTVWFDLDAMLPRAAIAAKLQGREAGSIRYGADDKPFFVRYHSAPGSVSW